MASFLAIGLLSCGIIHLLSRPYWAIFAVGVFASLGLIVLVSYSGYKFIKRHISTIEFLFELWLFYTIVGLTFGSFVFVINILRYLDDKELGYSQALTIPLFYFPIFCIATFFLYRKLVSEYFTLVNS